MRDLLLETYKSKIEPLIFWENHRQIKKWGVQEHDAYTWFTILAEEFGELAQAILQNEFEQGIPEKVIKEAIQTATLAIKIAEMYRAKLIDHPEGSEAMARNILEEQ